MKGSWMRFGRGAGLLVATALAMSGLSACGDESGPTPPATTASPIDKGTDSPSETSGPSDGASGGSADDAPAAAQAKTKVGAMAYTKFWFEQSARATHSAIFLDWKLTPTSAVRPARAFLTWLAKTLTKA